MWDGQGTKEETCKVEVSLLDEVDDDVCDNYSQTKGLTGVGSTWAW